MIPLLSVIALFLVVCAVVFLYWGMTGCSSGGKKHKFQARYSEEIMPPPIPAQQDQLAHATLIAMGVEAFTTHKRTYLHDVCVWCGKAVPPPQEPTEAANVRNQLEKNDA